MSKFFLSLVAVSMLGSPATAQTTRCRTDDPNCRGYATFGPAAVARCISIRGQTRSDFCQQEGDTQRVFIPAGARYCGVLGTGPVPDQCDLHWITVTEPQ